MREYIKERLKFIICLTVLIIGTVGLIVTSEIRASMLPVASETLDLKYVELDGQTYDYSGNAIKPEFTRLIFEDQKGQRVFIEAGEFKVKEYYNNTEVGYADAEVYLNGYQGTFFIKNAFFIRPATVTDLHIVSASKENIELAWEETVNVDGYQLYKRKLGTHAYKLIADIKQGETLLFNDSDVEFNAVYTYYVSAYKILGKEVVSGNGSQSVKHYTPLETPVISSVSNASYNTLQVKWTTIPGAVGYQIYRSDKKDGEFKLLTEVSSGNATAYSDATCECGKTYFYYIHACQQTDTETLYGEPSEVVSNRTTPNRPALSGTTTDGNTKVALKWKKVPGATGYEVLKNGQVVKTIDNADTVAYEEAGLSKETESSYKVRAYLIVDGQKLYGSSSGTYEKEYTITYNYGDTNEAIAALTQYVGRPYVYGGTSPTKGWDCSFFVQYVFKKHFGISLPRTSAQQVGIGSSVSKNNRTEWKPGDLLFYKEAGRVSHVAIYLGNGQMIHALSSKHDTLIQGVDYYEKWDTRTSLYCIKRILN